MTNQNMSEDQKTGGALHLSDDTFAKTLDEAKNNKQVVFVDFFAQWCGPCKMAAPIVDKLAGEYAGRAVIAKLDVDVNQKTAGQFGVMSIPTVIIFKDGQEVNRKVGFPGEEGYKQMIEQALG